MYAQDISILVITHSIFFPLSDFKTNLRWPRFRSLLTKRDLTHRGNYEYLWACRDSKTWMNSWRKRLSGCLEDATVGNISSVALRDIGWEAIEEKALTNSWRKGIQRK